MWVSPPSPPLLKGALTKATSSMSDKTEEEREKEGRKMPPTKQSAVFIWEAASPVF